MKHLKKEVLASVIVPTYNRKKLLGYTLDSLTRQTIDPLSFETIVVDDGSSDNTRELVNQYKDSLNIQYFRQEDKGYRVATARNIGIKASSTDICILVDASILLPSWGIEAHIQSHRQHQGPVAVLGYLYGMVKSEISNEPLRKLIDMECLDQSLEKIKALEEFGDFREKAFTACNEAIATLPAPWIFYWTANVSFTKSCFLDGEPFFVEDFNGNWGWEDVEFGYRLHKKGARFVLNPRAEAIHYPHDKYKDFEEASMVNLEKFRQLHPSPEVGILYDISTRDIDNVFLNDHLRKDLSKIIS